MLLPGLAKGGEWITLHLWASGYDTASLNLSKWYTALRPHDVMGWKARYEVVYGVCGGDAGEQILREGLEKNPSAPELLAAHFDLLVANGLIDEAREVLEQILGTAQRSNLALVASAVWAAQCKQYEEARGLCEEAARRLYPAEEQALFLRLISVVLLLPDEATWAKELLETALRNSRRWGTAHLLLGLLLREEDKKRSLELLKRAEKYWRGPASDYARFKKELENFLADRQGQRA